MRTEFSSRSNPSIQTNNILEYYFRDVFNKYKEPDLMPRIDYNQISKVYDAVRSSDVDLIRRMIACLDSSSEINILDLGCGTGNYTVLFDLLTRRQPYHIYGIDPSAGMLDKARKKDSQVSFQIGSAEHIPFSVGFFGLVYLTDVIHHVPDLPVMFREIRRVLAVGGKVCIATQSHQQIEHRPIARFFPGTVAVDQKRYPDISQIVSTASANGLIFLRQESMFENQPVELDVNFVKLVRNKGYSMLHLIGSKEYQSGLHSLEEAIRAGLTTLPSAGETLVWFTKEGGQ
jgi:ubiquinone/menaquinone biosynthesis C-methylase UbiE